MPSNQDRQDEMETRKILDGDGTAPKAIPEDTSLIGEDGIPLTPRDHPAVQFTSPGRDSKNGDAKVELGGVPPQFVGLGKEELMKYANDPFWVRLRWFLFILFWLIWLAMLAVAIAIIVLTPKCVDTSKVAAHIVNKGPYYQISLKSVASNGNKFIELQKEIDYIAKLNVKTVILSEFQDPNNLEEVDPIIGTLESLKEFLTALKEKEIHVLLQVSPNHSGKDNPWFTSNNEYYVTLDTEAVKDSTWLSQYGGNAWTPLGDGSKSYLHQFKESEADLNYRNNDVIKQMNSVLKHWYNFTDGAVSGFLLSDVSFLVENLDQLQDQNATINQEENKEILEKILDATEWDLNGYPYALLDTDYLDTKQKLQKYTGDAMIPILNDLARLSVNFTAEEIKKVVEASKSYFVIRRLSSPRTKRVTSVYSEDRAHLLGMITYLLPGEVVLYYGDEIGLRNSDVPSPASIDLSLEPMNWTPDASGVKIMEFYQCLGEAHRSFNDTTTKNDATYEDIKGAFVFKRKNTIVVTNLKEENAELNLYETFKITNGTVKCATPNADIAQGGFIDGNKFTAAAYSGYVIEVVGK